MNKVIFLFDLNSFFASAEISRNSDLIGKEVLISKQNNHAIVTACTPGAKEKGVYVGMPYYRAKKVIPYGVFIDPDHQYYVSLSNSIFNYIKKNFTEDIEVSSIDEAYIDATNYLLKTPISKSEFAREILDAVKNNFGVTASIGISENKFLAKMASEFYKWDEVATCYKHEIKSKLWTLDMNDMWGVGRAYSEYFEKQGIKKIGDFATIEETNPDKAIVLKRDLQSYYYTLMNWVWGKSTSELDLKIVDAKSVSKQITLEKYLEDDISVGNLIRELSNIVSKKLTSTNLSGSRINVMIKFGKFDSVDKSLTLPKNISRSSDIYEYAINIIDRLWNGSKPIKGARITISNLANEFTNMIQEPLDIQSNGNQDEQKKLVNNINSILGHNAITSGKDFKKNPKYQKDNAFKSHKIKFKSWD